MKSVVFAYSEIGCIGIEALLRHGIEVAAVFTHRDDTNENLWFRSVAELASSHGIPVYAPDDPGDPGWLERIRRSEPDVLFSFYYRKLLGAPILAVPKVGSFNLHGSLLPRYRGRAPINWALVNGESETGVTLHHMELRPDAGDIVGQLPVPIEDDDTAKTLMDKCGAAAATLLDATLPRLLVGDLPRTPQDEAAATYFGRRRPRDGEIDWRREARAVRNLVRAVTKPYPGAFSHLGDRKLLVWTATEVDAERPAAPGEVLDTAPLIVACGDGALRIDSGQLAGGLHVGGVQLAEELELREGMRFGSWPTSELVPSGRKRVLILGAGGFIGSALTERLLSSGRFDVHGMDLRSRHLAHLFDDPSFHFTEGDISHEREWIEHHVRECDVVVPLAAIATPMDYARDPLRVFELDFEENLEIVRACVRHGTRVIIPSTSEVYGMCDDEEFVEGESSLVMGPIERQRWIYASSKQLLDRVVWAYGQSAGLRFTIFRPFNWIGPRLDSLDAARRGSARVITRFIANLVDGTPITLIDGGHQRRCFTSVDEGVECLFRILVDERDVCDGQIVNIGNPDNDASIRELAAVLVDRFERHPLRRMFPPFAGYRSLAGEAYYGAGYQDIQHRRPNIAHAHRLVGWKPERGFHECVDQTLSYFLEQAAVRPEDRELEEAPSAP